MPPRDCFNSNPIWRNDFYFFYAEDLLVNQLDFDPQSLGLVDESEVPVNEADWSDDDDETTIAPPRRTPFTIYEDSDSEFEREDLTGSDTDSCSDSDDDYEDEMDFPQDSQEEMWARQMVEELYQEYLLSHGTADNPIDLTDIIE